MAQANWHLAADAERMGEAAAEHVSAAIVAAIAARGRACVAVPGGKTPVAIFRLLAADRRIDWSRVVLVPTDDRLVPPDDDLSNLRLLRTGFGATAAEIVPLTHPDRLDREAAAAFAEAALHALPWPIDLLWLGMGGDGHVGSILPGPDFDRALAEDRLAAAMMPDPLPPEAPVGRVTLTLRAMLETRAAMLTIAGADKRDVAERAIADGRAGATAIGTVIAAMPGPIDIFWNA